MYFLVVSRKRPEPNLEKYIGQYEFSVVPSSPFTSHAKLSLESKKADIMHAIEEKMKQANASQVNEQPAFSEAIVRLIEGTNH